jgi:hypothetical protein
MNKKLKKVDVFFTEDNKEKLRLKAESMGIGMATVIKIAVEEYLKK